MTSYQHINRVQCIHLRSRRTAQGPSAPFGRWWVGRLTSDVYTKRQLHSHGVGSLPPHHRPKIPRLPSGWRTSSVGELDGSITTQCKRKIFGFLPRYIQLIVFKPSCEFYLILLHSLRRFAYFAKACFFWLKMVHGQCEWNGQPFYAIPTPQQRRLWCAQVINNIPRQTVWANAEEDKR